MSALITLLIFLVLAIATVYKVEYHPTGNSKFFDIYNTKAMRGFWCVIVFLVHIPEAFQNPVQDMIGSFAYIGVTFFFMTSAFGLSVSLKKNNGQLGGFWKKRLPKLWIPQIILNVLVSVLNYFLLQKTITFLYLIHINIWVQNLLLCYLLFWLCNLLIRNDCVRRFLIMGLILAVSLLGYWAKQANVPLMIWSTEILGFLWGLLLAQYYDALKKFNNLWLLVSAAFCVGSLVLGLLYLKCKSAFFFGDYLLKILLGVAITGFILMLNKRFSLGNGAIGFLGELSFEIYLVHDPVISLVTEFLPKLSSGAFIVLCLLITIILSWGIHWLSQKLLRITHLA